VAKERGASEDRVRQLVHDNTDGSTFFLLGEPRVNVLRLNIALDKEFGAPPPQPAATAEPSARE
jgi:K+-transporting ATPase ATPase C chain